LYDIADTASIYGGNSTRVEGRIKTAMRICESRDQQIALAAQESERQYTWDLINAIRYGNTTLEEAKRETLERLSTTQVEIDMAKATPKQETQL
jgi:hypothetical protein